MGMRRSPVATENGRRRAGSALLQPCRRMRSSDQSPRRPRFSALQRSSDSSAVTFFGQCVCCAYRSESIDGVESPSRLRVGDHGAVADPCARSTCAAIAGAALRCMSLPIDELLLVRRLFNRSAWFPKDGLTREQFRSSDRGERVVCCHAETLAQVRDDDLPVVMDREFRSRSDQQGDTVLHGGRYRRQGRRAEVEARFTRSTLVTMSDATVRADGTRLRSSNAFLVLALVAARST
jgi:hypothetical protein